MRVAVDFHEHLALFGDLLELVHGNFLEEAGTYQLCHVMRPILNILQLIFELTIYFWWNTLTLHLLLQLLNLIIFDILTFKNRIKCLLKPAAPHSVYDAPHDSYISRSCLLHRQSYVINIITSIDFALFTLDILLRGLAFSNEFEDCRDIRKGQHAFLGGWSWSNDLAASIRLLLSIESQLFQPCMFGSQFD